MRVRGIGEKTAGSTRQRAQPSYAERRFRLVARGYTNAEIGENLFISQHTAATHVHRILEKTRMANRAEAAFYAIRNGLAEA